VLPVFTLGPKLQQSPFSLDCNPPLQPDTGGNAQCGDAQRFRDVRWEAECLGLAALAAILLQDIERFYLPARLGVRAGVISFLELPLLRKPECDEGQ